MIDREKVINGLKICSEYGAWHGIDCELSGAYKDCPYRGCETGCVVTIAKDAIALLEEQKPVKLKIYNKNPGVWWYLCGNCESPISQGYMLCPTCGRRVDWDDRGGN